MLDLVQRAERDDLPVRAMVKLAEKQFLTGCIGYTAKYIAPPVMQRGLIEKRPVLLSFVYHVTAAGEAERARLRSALERADTIPSLLKSDRARAVALASSSAIRCS